MRSSKRSPATLNAAGRMRVFSDEVCREGLIDVVF